MTKCSKYGDNPYGLPEFEPDDNGGGPAAPQGSFRVTCTMQYLVKEPTGSKSTFQKWEGNIGVDSPAMLTEGGLWSLLCKAGPLNAAWEQFADPSNPLLTPVLCSKAPLGKDSNAVNLQGVRGLQWWPLTMNPTALDDKLTALLQGGEATTLYLCILCPVHHAKCKTTYIMKPGKERGKWCRGCSKTTPEAKAARKTAEEKRKAKKKKGGGATSPPSAKRTKIAPIDEAITTFGDTRLHCAAKEGNLTRIKELVTKENADVTVKNKTGSTPLHQAAHRGHAEVVAFLLANNADPCAETASGRCKPFVQLPR